jgi:predicted nucleotidyltransferase/predicted transcriptional regulator with HTH domain
MLDIITKSKIRQKMIALFLYNRDSSYFLSEISRLVAASAGTTQRELNRLIAQDIVNITMRGSHKLYSLNNKYLFLPELESIFNKVAGIEKALSDALRDCKGIDYVFLFGSYVKGGFKSASDIDLFVIGTVNDDALYHVINTIEKDFNRAVNYHRATKEEFAQKAEKEYFYKDVLQQYKVILGDEGEFRKNFAKSH